MIEEVYDLCAAAAAAAIGVTKWDVVCGTGPKGAMLPYHIRQMFS